MTLVKICFARGVLAILLTPYLWGRQRQSRDDPCSLWHLIHTDSAAGRSVCTSYYNYSVRTWDLLGAGGGARTPQEKESFNRGRRKSPSMPISFSPYSTITCPMSVYFDFGRALYSSRYLNWIWIDSRSFNSHKSPFCVSTLWRVSNVHTFAHR